MSPDDHGGSGAVGFQDVIDPFTLVGGWVGQCRERMKGVGMRYFGGNEDLAEEMVQEACFVALKRAHREPDLVRGVRDPCRWLVAITWNVVRTWRRNRAVRARLRKENADEIRLELDPKDEIDCVIGCRGRFNAISTNRKVRDINPPYSRAIWKRSDVRR